MARGNKSKPGANTDNSVLTLKLDSHTRGAEPVELGGGNNGGFATPCTITGLGAGLSGGLLGYVFGFGGYWMRNRLKGTFKSSLAEGWGSAKSFAIMGGLYATVTCFMKRIRQKEDGWNGAAAGCATGLALGWSGGPASAAQSCALFGIFSFFLDNMAGTSPAQAAGTARLDCDSSQLGYKEVKGAGAGGAAALTSAWTQLAAQLAKHAHLGLALPLVGKVGETGLAQQAQRSKEAVRALLSPAMPLLGVLSPCQFGPLNEGSGCCRLKRADGGLP